MKAKNPVVWYPYYGSWLIGLVAEAIFFTSVLTCGISPDAFTYVQVTVQACRMLVLVLLSTVLFAKPSKRIGADEESASLLGHGKGESDDTQASNAKSKYGSITITPSGEAVDLEYEAQQQKEDQERKDLHEKRIQAQGNWFTYDSPREISLQSCLAFQSYLAASASCLTVDVIVPVHSQHGANLRIDTPKLFPSSYLTCGPQRTAYSRQSFLESVSASSVLEH